MIEFPQIKIRMQLRRLQTIKGEVIMQEEVEPVIADLVGSLRQAAKWNEVKDGYGYTANAHYNRQYYQVTNSSDKFELEEWGAQPHDILQPPHAIPGGKLIDWMDERSIPIEMYGYIQFVLHAPPSGWWATHNPGFAGDHHARNTIEEYKPKVQSAIDTAMRRMIEPVGYIEYG